MTTIVPANTSPNPAFALADTPMRSEPGANAGRYRQKQSRTPVDLSVQRKDAAGNAGQAHDNNDLHAVCQHEIQAAHSAQRHQYKNTGPNLQ